MTDETHERRTGALFSAIRALGEACQAVVIDVREEARRQVEAAGRLLDAAECEAQVFDDQAIVAAVQRARAVAAAIAAVANRPRKERP